jgi:uncharacterized membrane protein
MLTKARLKAHDLEHTVRSDVDSGCVIKYATLTFYMLKQLDQSHARTAQRNAFRCALANARYDSMPLKHASRQHA